MLKEAYEQGFTEGLKEAGIEGGLARRIMAHLKEAGLDSVTAGRIKEAFGPEIAGAVGAPEHRGLGGFGMGWLAHMLTGPVERAIARKLGIPPAVLAAGGPLSIPAGYFAGRMLKDKYRLKGKE